MQVSMIEGDEASRPGREGGRLSSDNLLQIGEAAEKVGLSLRTVRYWEEIGLGRSPRRGRRRLRLYSEADLARLLVVKAMKPLGLTLEQMREILDLVHAAEVRESPRRGRGADRDLHATRAGEGRPPRALPRGRTRPPGRARAAGARVNRSLRPRVADCGKRRGRTPLRPRRTAPSRPAAGERSSAEAPGTLLPKTHGNSFIEFAGAPRCEGAKPFGSEPTESPDGYIPE